MSFNGEKRQKVIKQLVGGVEENDMATHQEAIPVTYFAGEAKLPGMFLCRPYNEFARPVSGKPSKK